MIRVFRQIRHRLVQSNGTQKYLLYAAGEVLLIVVGVLFALGLNNMNNFRVDRLQSKQILKRVDGELQANLTQISNMKKMVEAKLVSLDAIAPYLNFETPIENPETFLAQVIRASSFGWEQPAMEQTTFNEIVSSGTLGLILNIEIRLKLSRFYHTASQREHRSTMRITDFPKVTYALIPRETENSLRADLSPEEIETIAERVLKSNLRDHLIAERNRTKFMLTIWQSIQEEAVELANLIRPPKLPDLELPN